MTEGCARCGKPTAKDRKYCSRECRPCLRMTEQQREAIAGLYEVGASIALIARATEKPTSTIFYTIKSLGGRL